ncbi:MAG: hypothetical protein M3015_10455 [Bacteroidota bacterium]|nr:hypothetical protein [Bacteroidota bacterium]
MINTLTLITMLFANYAGSTGYFYNKTVAEVSYKYDSLFAPAGYAFVIWGAIFLLCVCFVIYQWFLLRNKNSYQYIHRTGLWFSISNLANAAWVYCWTSEMMGLSVFVILLLLLSLIYLTISLRLELDDVPVRSIFFVWWPITFYLGWIMVATIACIASWLTSIGWNAFNLEGNIWTIILITIATLLYLLLIKKRSMREAAMVGVWAFIAIAIKQWNTHSDVSIAAIIASVALTAASIMHVYKNRKYNIIAKLQRGEW